MERGGVLWLWEGSGQVGVDGSEDLLEREGGGKVEFDSSQSFTDSGPDFEETVLQSVILSLGPLGPLEAFLGQGMEEHIGGAVQEESELVGLEAVAGGSV
jgi:hypothetical protein